MIHNEADRKRYLRNIVFLAENGYTYGDLIERNRIVDSTKIGIVAIKAQLRVTQATLKRSLGDKK